MVHICKDLSVLQCEKYFLFWGASISSCPNSWTCKQSIKIELEKKISHEVKVFDNLPISPIGMGKLDAILDRKFKQEHTKMQTKLIGRLRTEGGTQRNSVPIQFTIWSFELNGLLQLNITILEIKFRANAIKSCVFGFMEINMFVSRQKNKKKTFLFCGTYHSFQIYPNTPVVGVYIHAFTDLHHLTHLHYSVTDVSRITSLHISKYNQALRWQTKSIKPEWTLLLPMKRLSVQFYHLAVQKFSRIKVEIRIFPTSRQRGILILEALILEAYGGPSALSGYLQPFNGSFNPKVYFGSSFQCIFHTYIFIQSVKFMLSFSGVSTRNILHLFIPKENTNFVLLYPDIRPCSKFAICAMNIHTTKGYHFNMSIVTLNYHGLPSVLCRYGGMTVYEQKSSIWSEIATFCSSEMGAQFLPTLYSGSSSVLVIFYSYAAQVEDIKININLGVTKCKGIVINICRYSSEDFEQRVFQFSPSNPSHLTFSLEEESCVIIQPRYFTESDLYRHSCEVFVRPGGTEERGKEIMYKITGFFASYHYDIGSHTPMFYILGKCFER